MHVDEHIKKAPFSMFGKFEPPWPLSSACDMRNIFMS